MLTEDELLHTYKIFYRMIKDYADGKLGNGQHYYRARVEASDPVGGQLESTPPNPPNSVRARVYTAGLDATTPREALVVFYPLGVGCPSPGEHVIVVFEDQQMTSGYWLAVVPAFYDKNYSNPDMRTKNRNNASYAFEGDPQVSSTINKDLEYGGSITKTEGRQELVDVAESGAQENRWRGKRVLLIGDSQVAGPWGTKLGEILRGQHEVSYFAKDGRVGWGVISWLNGQLTPTSPRLQSIQEVIERHNPAIVVVSLGGNDGSSGRAQRSDYTEKVREMYQIVSSRVPLVIWSGPPTAVGRNANKQPGRQIAARKIQEVVGNKFVDVSSITNTTQGRSPDGIHFTNSSPVLDPWAEAVIRKGYEL